MLGHEAHPVPHEKEEVVNTYAERLGHLAPEQLQVALDRFGLGRLIATAPVTAGNFGQNVFVTTSTGE